MAIPPGGNYHTRLPLPGGLCLALAEAAGQIWDFLLKGWQAQITPSEETLTETVLINIQTRHPHEVITYKFSQYQEGRQSGADWEWWFNSPGAWLGIRVQAKKIDQQLHYPELLHVTPKGVRQIDLLLDSCRRDRLYPLYCFYNAWAPPGPNVPWNCLSFAPTLRALGCTVAAAAAVQPLVTVATNALAAVAPFARPWNCLVCCGGFSPPDVSLPERVLAFLGALPGAGRESLDLLQPSPPSYVQAVVEARLTMMPETPPDISHLIVVSEGQLR